MTTKAQGIYSPAGSYYVTLVSESGENVQIGTITDVATATITTVDSVSSASTTLKASNADRKALYITNTDANALYVKFGATASSSSFTVTIPSNGYYEMPQPIYTGVVDGIWAANGSGIAAITEL